MNKAYSSETTLSIAYWFRPAIAEQKQSLKLFIWKRKTKNAQVFTDFFAFDAGNIISKTQISKLTDKISSVNMLPSNTHSGQIKFHQNFENLCFYEHNIIQY